MILSHKYKVIFFCNGKTGSTSIEHALQHLQEGAQYDFGVPGLYVPKHIPPAILKGTLPDKIWREYFKVVFVRNPWDWFVSNWFYNKATPRHASPNRQAGLKPALKNVVRLVAGRRRHSSGQEKPDSEPVFGVDDVDFLFELLKQFRGLPGQEGLYQSSWVFDPDGNQLVDYIGKFETLDQDFAQIRNRLGLDLSLPHLNQTQHKDYKKYFSPESRQRVEELWALDVRNFGYSFD